MSDDVLDIWVNLVTSQGGRAVPRPGRSTPTSRATSAASGERGRRRRRAARPRWTSSASRPASSPPGSTARRRGARGGRRAPGPVPRGARRSTEPGKPTRNVRRIRELAEHPRFSMVRVMPLVTQVPIDDARHYPVYQVCEELGIPVGINVGIPGPARALAGAAPRAARGRADRLPRSRRHRRAHGPSLRGAAHELHAQVDRTSTCRAPRTRRATWTRRSCAFMNTKTYRGRVLWGSDEPWFPMRRSLAEARALAARRRGDGAVPRRHRPPPPRPHQPGLTAAR